MFGSTSKKNVFKGLKNILTDIDPLSSESVECLNFIVPKILSTQDDDITNFKPELEEISKISFKFDILMNNRMMEFSSVCFDIYHK